MVGIQSFLVIVLVKQILDIVCFTRNTTKNLFRSKFLQIYYEKLISFRFNLEEQQKE